MNCARRLNWTVLVLLCAGSVSAVAADPDATSTGGGWGCVSGQMVYGGDLKDPALKSYQEDVKIYEPTGIKDNIRGVVPRVIAKVPNESLLIDPKTRGIKNVFVFLKRTPQRVHPSLAARAHKPVEVAMRGHRFVPHALTISVGQTVRMLSPEGAADFNGTKIYNSAFNVLATPDKPAEWTPKKAERAPAMVQSAIHPGSASYWLVSDHPYATLTKADGTFRLENLPEGEHALGIWHEVFGYVKAKHVVTVGDGEIQELEPIRFKLGPPR